MRVNIEHKEEAKGVRKNKPVYLVNVAVQFSEAERATINARNLYKNWVDISPGSLASTVVDTNPDTVRRVGIILIVAGIVALFFRTYENLFILTFIGIGVFIYGKYLERKFLKGEKDTVTIKNLLSGPISIRASNPVHAKAVDDHVRSSLVELKGFIEGSETLGRKDTFEL